MKKQTRLIDSEITKYTEDIDVFTKASIDSMRYAIAIDTLIDVSFDGKLDKLTIIEQGQNFTFCTYDILIYNNKSQMFDTLSNPINVELGYDLAIPHLVLDTEKKEWISVSYNSDYCIIFYKFRQNKLLPYYKVEAECDDYRNIKSCRHYTWSVSAQNWTVTKTNSKNISKENISKVVSDWLKIAIR